MKKYIVVERNRKFNSFDLINEDTTGLDDIWETHIPYKLNVEERSRIKPLIFDNRSDAVKYKDKHQSDWNRDWRENDYIYKRYGDSKPKWKIEEYTGNLFR
jgi:hypothetical protein